MIKKTVVAFGKRVCLACVSPGFDSYLDPIFFSITFIIWITGDDVSLTDNGVDDNVGFSATGGP